VTYTRGWVGVYLSNCIRHEYSCILVNKREGSKGERGRRKKSIREERKGKKKCELLYALWCIHLHPPHRRIAEGIPMTD